jgi:hypothetical protein
MIEFAVAIAVVVVAAVTYRITCPFPTAKVNGLPRSREESNFRGESNPSSHPV